MNSAEIEPRPAAAAPLVSVVVLNYNYAQFLADAIELRETRLRLLGPHPIDFRCEPRLGVGLDQGDLLGVHFRVDRTLDLVERAVVLTRGALRDPLAGVFADRRLLEGLLFEQRLLEQPLFEGCVVGKSGGVHGGRLRPPRRERLFVGARVDDGLQLEKRSIHAQVLDQGLDVVSHVAVVVEPRARGRVVGAHVT